MQYLIVVLAAKMFCRDGGAGEVIAHSYKSIFRKYKNIKNKNNTRKKEKQFSSVKYSNWQFFPHRRSEWIEKTLLHIVNTFYPENETTERKNNGKGLPVPSFPICTPERE